MKTKKKGKTITLIILDVLIVLIVIYFVLGYFNFFKITKNQKPIIAGKETSYNKDEGEVTVHNYVLYKIVKYKVPGKNITYSMKLWFMDDVK